MHRTRIRVLTSSFAERTFLFAFLFKTIAFSRWFASDILTVAPIPQRFYKTVRITTHLTNFNHLFILFDSITSTYVYRYLFFRTLSHAVVFFYI